MTVIGVDGCRAGWLAISLAETFWDVAVFGDIQSLWEDYRGASLILVDIPIGLRAGGTAERLCDKKARAVLGQPRGSSVFPVPCRPAVYAPEKQASEVNKTLTGRGLSQQSRAIIPKIRQVDELLSVDRAAHERIREVHPEVCFWGLAGRAMKHKKKSRDGFEERRKVLADWYPQAEEVIASALDKFKRKCVARDDVLDALVAAVTARAGPDNLLTLPKAPERDPRGPGGLPMEMVYRRA